MPMTGVIKLPKPLPRGLDVTAENLAKSFGGGTKPTRKNGVVRKGHIKFAIIVGRQKFNLDVPKEHWEKLQIARG